MKTEKIKQEIAKRKKLIEVITPQDLLTQVLLYHTDKVSNKQNPIRLKK